MGGLFIPTLSHWQLGNPWSGSLGRGSYHVTPRKREEERDGETVQIPELYVEAWTGPLCYELSAAERTACFPVTEEGLEAMRLWLEENLTALDEAAGT